MISKTLADALDELKIQFTNDDLTSNVLSVVIGVKGVKNEVSYNFWNQSMWGDPHGVKDKINEQK